MQHRKTNIAARKLEADWPAACELINGVCDYVSEAVCVDDEPLVFVAARRALRAYDEMLSGCRNDRARLDRFLSELLIPVAEALDGMGIADVDSNHVWRPDIGDPMRDWLERDDRSSRLDRLRVTETDAETCDIIEAMVEDTLLPVDSLTEAC